jgi:hypothetical protein
MKTKIIFGIIAVAGAFALYFWKDNEILAASFVLLVWGVYERITKEAIKTDFKESNNGMSVTEYRKYK